MWGVSLGIPGNTACILPMQMRSYHDPWGKFCKGSDICATSHRKNGLRSVTVPMHQRTGIAVPPALDRRPYRFAVVGTRRPASGPALRIFPRVEARWHAAGQMPPEWHLEPRNPKQGKNVAEIDAVGPSYLPKLSDIAWRPGGLRHEHCQSRKRLFLRARRAYREKDNNRLGGSSLAMLRRSRR